MQPTSIADSKFKHYMYLMSFLLILVSYPVLAQNLWSISLNESNGLPVIGKGGGEALSSSFVFWGNNWGWANFEQKFKVEAPGQYSLHGASQNLGFCLDAKITKSSARQINWDMLLDAKSDQKNIIGGGLSFSFDLNKYQNELGEPQILADKSGWSWGKSNNVIEFRISPKPADIHFERGNKNEIRAFLFSGNLVAGKTQYHATLSIPENITITPTVSERFGSHNIENWTKNILDWEESPIDVSFLNQSEKPAGKHGFVKAVDDQLIFEDASVAKFWGTNITAYTLFMTPKDKVKAQAKRLSALGFNLVRLHHHDSIWVEPNIFGNRNQSSTQVISKESMDKIDWWIKCLKDEGIYVWVDLHVGRALKTADGITAFDEIRKSEATANLKGYNYVNPSIQKAMRDFSLSYLTHVNKYTNTRFVDEPAIAAVLITNENDLTYHFGNALLADKNVPEHNKMFMLKAHAFAAQNDLSLDKITRTWEHGSSKLFLNDLEHQFDVEMINYLHTIGLKVPIITTNTWGNNPLSSLPALTTGDIVDVHTYQGFGALEKNPLYASNLTQWMAAGQVINKPMSVSEWNAEPFPTEDRHVLPLFVASQASLQGWDALMQYAYSQDALTGTGSPSNWQAYNDPATLATMPAAALMYRRGDLKTANTTYALDLGKEALFNQMITPENSVFLRTAPELGKVVIAMPNVKELPWLQKSKISNTIKVFKDPNFSLIKSDATESISDTGEIKHNWEKGQLSINTPRTQAITGWIGSEKFKLEDVEISASTPNATIIIQSADENPINKSRKIIISLAARSNTLIEGKMPFLSEPVLATLKINAEKGLKLYQMTGSGSKKELPVLYENGQYQIHLDKTIKSYWLTLM